MSPQLALESTIYLGYVAMVAGILAVAGASLAVLRRLFACDFSHPLRSYQAWLLIVPTVALVIFLGRVPTILFIVALAFFGLFEFARATGLIKDRLTMAILLLGTAAAGLFALLSDPTADSTHWQSLFWALPAWVTAALVCLPVLRNRAQGQLNTMGVGVLGFLYIGWMFGHLALLANSEHAYGYLSFLFVAVELSDVTAYVCGRAFGRRLLRSNISPKKTWEGATGALTLSMLLPWLLWFSFPHFGPLQLILTGLIVGVGGQLGDLSMSVIKRDVGIKDMGAAIPGHGGVLDRIDSMIFVAPLFFYMTQFFT